MFANSIPSRWARVTRSITANVIRSPTMPIAAMRRISSSMNNVLDVNYFREMNKTFDNGAVASTNTQLQNFDAWISAGYAVWFPAPGEVPQPGPLDAQHQLRRFRHGLSCPRRSSTATAAGSGISALPRHQFSANSIWRRAHQLHAHGRALRRSSPSRSAIPGSTRFRWAKSFWVFHQAPEARPARTSPPTPRAAASPADMLMTIAPGVLLTIISVTFNAIIIALAAAGLVFTGVMVASSVYLIDLLLLPHELHGVHVHVRVLTTFVEMGFCPPPRAEDPLHVHVPVLHAHVCAHRVGGAGEKCNWKPIKHRSVDDREFASESRP